MGAESGMLRKYAGPGILALLGLGAQVSGITNIWLAILLWGVALAWVLIVLPWRRIRVQSPLVLRGMTLQALPERLRLDADHLLEAAEKSRSLTTLRLLQDIGTHMLLNRPVSDDAYQRQRLSENLDWWEAEAIETAKKAGASSDVISKFKTLGLGPLEGSIIPEKLRRLDAIIAETEASFRSHAERVAERIRSMRGIVVSSVDVEHVQRIVEISPLEQPQVTAERTRRYLEAEVELLCLGYRVHGWPG